MIPPFDHNNVLPPLNGGGAADPNAQSPYKSDILEVCHRFAITPERITILKGFVQFRLDCLAHGVVNGFQWLDGSFVENIEVTGHRAPNDIDVVTIIAVADRAEEIRITSGFPAFINPTFSKSTYHVDNYPFIINHGPMAIIAATKYWMQLFSHNRLGVWKGMLEIPLYNNDVFDRQAMDFLNTL